MKQTAKVYYLRLNNYREYNSRKVKRNNTQSSLKIDYAYGIRILLKKKSNLRNIWNLKSCYYNAEEKMSKLHGNIKQTNISMYKPIIF